MVSEESDSPATKRKNLILIGFMGTGKSSVGKRVAASLGFRFVDTDGVVVKMAGKTIPEIFADEGEGRFREFETEALRACVDGDGLVIATGGGIVTRKENRELLQGAGHVVWLKADPETILGRVSRNEERPLVQTDDPLATIRDLLEKREALYRATASEEVNSAELTLDETCHGVTESARVALSDPGEWVRSPHS